MPPSKPTVILSCGGIRLHPKRRQAFVSKQEIHLTGKGFNLLRLLLEAGGDVVERADAIQAVWARPDASRTIDVHISRIRAALGGEVPRLVTVKGMGWRMETGDPTWAVSPQVNGRRRKRRAA